MDASELAENGREEYGWRLILDEPALVVVELGFTVAGQEGEAFAAFKTRMLTLARALGLLGYPVASLIFQRRRAQGKRHWAEFTCCTPETGLPVPRHGEGGAMGEPYRTGKADGETTL